MKKKELHLQVIDGKLYLIANKNEVRFEAILPIDDMEDVYVTKDKISFVTANNSIEVNINTSDIEYYE